jgi:hypothetical protein
MRRSITAAALVLGLAIVPHGAWGHSFNVGLVVALVEPTIAEIRQVRDGFLLAARERDGHPDEESDGHLGGLDVYVHLVSLDGGAPSAVRALLQRERIDILAVIGPGHAAEKLQPLVAGAPTVLLAPGRLPSPVPSAFVRAFQVAFGYPPGKHAAEGYNAGRRIDAAVRPLDSVGDPAALRRAFDETRDGLDW